MDLSGKINQMLVGAFARMAQLNIINANNVSFCSLPGLVNSFDPILIYLNKINVYH
jgi:hypothetical protein